LLLYHILQLSHLLTQLVYLCVFLFNQTLILPLLQMFALPHCQLLIQYQIPHSRSQLLIFLQFGCHLLVYRIVLTYALRQ
jgi:hypothetical protein